MAPRMVPRRVSTHLVADPLLRELGGDTQPLSSVTSMISSDASATIQLRVSTHLVADPLLRELGGDTQPLPPAVQLLDVATQPLPSAAQAPPPAVQAPPLLAARKRPRERLEELEDLKNLLTDAEYQSKRAEIIASV